MQAYYLGENKLKHEINACFFLFKFKKTNKQFAPGYTALNDETRT